jgi:MinD superfamily P-loop ATPase
LNVGEAMSPPAIRAVKEAVKTEDSPHFNLVQPLAATKKGGSKVESRELIDHLRLSTLDSRLSINETSEQSTHKTQLKTLIILDCPPGTSCPVIESVRGSDLVLLVTEPTPFGLHDLKLAVEMVRALKLPLAVVLNRCDVGDDQVRQYCTSQRISVLAEIPDDRAVAEAYSRGQLACRAAPSFADRIRALLKRLQNGAAR